MVSFLEAQRRPCLSNENWYQEATQQNIESPYCLRKAPEVVVDCSNYSIYKVDPRSVKLKKTDNYLEVVSHSSNVDDRIKEASRRVLNKEIGLERQQFCSALKKNPFTYPAMGPCCINTLEGTNNRECSCDDFDRRDKPGIRESYENAAINKLLPIIEQQVRSSRMFSINLTIFAPGFLGSEVFLISRLLNEIKKHGYKGNFVLNLVDQSYTEIVNSVSLDNLSDNRNNAYGAAIVDFIQMLKLQGGENIKFQTRLFKSDQDYIDICKADTLNKSDLLISSDFGLDVQGNMLNIVQRLYKETSFFNDASNQNIVVLYSQQAGTHKYFGSGLNFADPSLIFRKILPVKQNRQQERLRSRVRRREQESCGLSDTDKKIVITTCVVLVIIGFGLYFYIKHKK